MIDYVQRFLFDDLDIRGAVVRLAPAWRSMQAGRNYAWPVARLLGEMTAVATLIGAQLKHAGRITFQLQSEGAIRLLVVDCNERLGVRGMAKAREGASFEGAIDTATLLGTGNPALAGRLILILDLANGREPYQSIVPLDGDSVAEIFQLYLELSDQQPTRLYLAATPTGLGGLFLQKMPGADQRDDDGWNRVTKLAATVQDDELLYLSTEDLMGRLFAEEDIRIYSPAPVSHDSPESLEKVQGMLLSLGRDEIESILREFGEVRIHDDMGNRDYCFDAADIAKLFGTSDS